MEDVQTGPHLGCFQVHLAQARAALELVINGHGIAFQLATDLGQPRGQLQWLQVNKLLPGTPEARGDDRDQGMKSAQAGGQWSSPTP